MTSETEKELQTKIAQNIAGSDDLVKALEEYRDTVKNIMLIMAIQAMISGEVCDPVKLVDQNFNLFIEVVKLREQDKKEVSSFAN